MNTVRLEMRETVDITMYCTFIEGMTKYESNRTNVPLKQEQ